MRIERIYDRPTGGRRILIDRLWPRGIRKQDAGIDHWAKEIAPSNALRRAFHGGMPREQFEEEYRRELEHADLSVLEGDDVVLLTAAKNRPNHADVLRAIMQERADP